MREQVRFVQIVSIKEALYWDEPTLCGLTKDGKVWEFNRELGAWYPLPMEEGWIDEYGDRH